MPLLFRKFSCRVLKKKKSKEAGQPGFEAGSVISSMGGMFNYQLQEHHFAKMWNAP